MKTWMRNAVLKSGHAPHNPSETNPALALFNLNKAISYHNQYKAYVTALVSAQKFAPSGRDKPQKVHPKRIRTHRHMRHRDLVSHVSRAHHARATTKAGK